jgi:hypothetical protein
VEPVSEVIRRLTFTGIMGFHCPWGCAEDVEHENAWECPKFSQKFLGALQGIAQKLDKREL